MDVWVVVEWWIFGGLKTTEPIIGIKQPEMYSQTKMLSHYVIKYWIHFVMINPILIHLVFILN